MRRIGVAGRVGLLILGAFVVIQLIPVERTNPPVVSALQAPDSVVVVLRRACYDCHSHQTQWPWYSRLAPVSWLLASHVEEGREHLNFSRWPVSDPELQGMLRAEIREEVTAGQMPLRSYALLHPEARLSREDREVLLRWARAIRSP